MAALLVGIAVMSIMMAVAMPVWNHAIRREKEEELIFRGNQYVRAINLFQRKNPGGLPPNVDSLVKQKFLRKKFKDPMVADGEFQLVSAGAAMQAGQTAGGSGRGQSGRGSQISGRGSQPIGSPPMSSRGSIGSSGTFLGPVAGVVSKSTEKSIKLYNGRDHYNEWLFVFSAANNRGQGQGPGTGPGRGGSGQGQGGRGRGMGPGGMGPGGGRGQGSGRGQGGRGPGSGRPMGGSDR